MERVFVTGGSGFLGGALIRRLVAEGVEVRALGRSAKARAAVAAAGAQPVRGELDDGMALVQGMDGCDVVIHAAAKVAAWGDPAEFRTVNVDGTRNVLSAARRAGVPRVVHVGTESVLISGPPLVDADETHPLPARTLGLYGATKAEAERRVLAANSETLATLVVRPRFVWGKGDTTLLPQMVEAVRRGRWMWIDGGRYLTSTTHVANAVEGILLAARRGRGGEAYFITDGEPVEFRSFITDLLATQGAVPPDRSLSHAAAARLGTAAELAWRVLRLKSDPPITRALVKLMGQEITVSDAKARRELGYTPPMSREAGFAEMRADRTAIAG